MEKSSGLLEQRDRQTFREGHIRAEDGSVQTFCDFRDDRDRRLKPFGPSEAKAIKFEKLFSTTPKKISLTLMFF